MQTSPQCPSSEIDWYIGYTHPQCEVDAGHDLYDAGYDPYLPLGRRTVTIKTRYRRVKQEVLRPAFPRYIFVGVKPGQCVDSIRDIKSIADLLTNDGAPIRALARKVKELQARQSVGEFDDEKGQRIKANDTVAIQSGPFEGFRCKVRATPNNKSVLVDLDGRKVSIPMEILELVP